MVTKELLSPRVVTGAELSNSAKPHAVNRSYRTFVTAHDNRSSCGGVIRSASCECLIFINAPLY
jgi:hypothetical protein